MRVLYTTVFILVLTIPAIAVKSEQDDYDVEKRLSFCSGFLFNGKDLFTGFGAGFENITHQWAFRLDVDFRPFFKKVQVSNEDGTVDQFFERKTLLSIVGEKRFLKLPIGETNLRFLLGAKGGVMFGNYRGLRQSAEVLPFVLPYAGATLDMNMGGLFKFGYAFIDMQNPKIPQHRFFIGFTFYLTSL